MADSGISELSRSGGPSARLIRNAASDGRPEADIGQFDDDESEISLILNILRRRKGLIVAISGLLTVMSVAVILTLAARYEAEAAIVLDTRPSKRVDVTAAAVNQLLGGPQADVDVVHSEMAILHSPQFAAIVIERLDLMGNGKFWKNSDTVGGAKEAVEQSNAAEPPSGWIVESLLENIAAARAWIEGTVETMQGWYATVVPAKPSLPKMHNRDTAVQHLLRNLSVTSDPRSYVIRVRYQSEDPQLAAAIVNELVDSYLGLQLSEKRTAIKRANAWLNERLAELREKMNRSDAALEIFKEASGLGEIRGVTVNAQQLSEINSQLIAATAERAQKEAELKEIQAFKAGGLDAASQITAAPALKFLREQQMDLARQRADLAARLGSSHPQMVNLEIQLRDVQRRLDAEVAGTVRGLTSALRAVQAREASLRSSVALLQQGITASSDKRVQLRQLERDAETDRLVFTNLLNQAKDLQNEGDIQQSDARLIFPATAPLEPAFPQKRVLAFLALVVSTLIGLTVAFIREFQDRTFRSTRQLERTTRRPCIGLTPSFGRAAAADEISLRRSTSVYVDAVRSIRVGLGGGHSLESPKIVMVTSAVPGEGKSTFSLSLARSAAHAGYRSLLVDCDLRNPSVSRLLKQVSGLDLVSICKPAAGSDVVAADEADETETDAASGMDFIPTAGGAQSPQDLLSSQAMRKFLDRMRQSYDLIVLDTSPLLAANDAALLSRLADTTVLLVQWGVTPRAVIVHALRILAREGANVAGTVLSRVDLRRYRSYGGAERGYFFGHYARHYGAKQAQEADL
jgi:succinoglycan biosynthesis transport protein ExoP